MQPEIAMDSRPASSTRPNARLRIDLESLTNAMLDSNHGSRYFLDLATGTILPAFHDDADAPSQAVIDSIEYDPRYEPIPTLSGSPAHLHTAGPGHRLWLEAEALFWLSSLEERSGVCFRVEGLYGQESSLAGG